MWGCLCIARLSVTLPLRVMMETQTQQKLKGIKVFAAPAILDYCVCLWAKILWKWRDKSFLKSLSKNSDSLCLLFLHSLLLHLCNVNKTQMSSFLSLSDEFMPDLITVAPATTVAALQWAAVFINSGLAAVTVPLLHHSSALALCCTHQLTPTFLCTWGAPLNCCHTDSCC